MNTSQPYSALVQINLHINDGPTYKIGKCGNSELFLHQDETSATFTEKQSKLAILEIIVDGKPTRKAVLISRYSQGKIHLNEM